MSDESDDLGTIQALLDRMQKYRLPRAMEIKERVDAGERLTESEFEFLQRVIADAQDWQRLVKDHPEFHPLASQILQLISDIVGKALENQQKP